MRLVSAIYQFPYSKPIPTPTPTSANTPNLPLQTLSLVAAAQQAQDHAAADSQSPNPGPNPSPNPSPNANAHASEIAANHATPVSGLSRAPLVACADGLQGAAREVEAALALLATAGQPSPTDTASQLAGSWAGAAALRSFLGHSLPAHAAAATCQPHAGSSSGGIAESVEAQAAARLDVAMSLLAPLQAALRQAVSPAVSGDVFRQGEELRGAAWKAATAGGLGLGLGLAGGIASVDGMQSGEEEWGEGAYAAAHAVVEQCLLAVQRLRAAAFMGPPPAESAGAKDAERLGAGEGEGGEGGEGSLEAPPLQALVSQGIDCLAALAVEQRLLPLIARLEHAPTPTSTHYDSPTPNPTPNLSLALAPVGPIPAALAAHLTPPLLALQVRLNLNLNPNPTLTQTLTLTPQVRLKPIPNPNTKPNPNPNPDPL